MRTTFLLFTLFSAFFLTAQSQEILTVEPATVVKEILLDHLDEDFIDVSTVTVTNNSQRTIRLARTQAPAERPSAWRYQDAPQRGRATPYLSPTKEQDPDGAVELLPGQSATFSVSLRPDGVTGSGRTELRFYDLAAPGTTLGRASFATKIVRKAAPPPPVVTETVTAPVARPPAAPKSIRLYPNPAPEAFFIELPAGQKVGRVEVSNTLGRKLKRYDGGNKKEGYDIENLPDGLYLISIFDETGKKVKTMRLLHRSFGA